MHLRTRLVRTTSAALLLAGGLSACEQTTSPALTRSSKLALRAITVVSQVPAPAPYPGVPVGDRSIVCKSASSPEGSYDFGISADSLFPGDEIASRVTLSPGQCTIVYHRGAPGFGTTKLTIFEHFPPNPTYVLDHVSLNDIDGARSVLGPTVTIKVSDQRGSTATFFNETRQHPPLPIFLTYPTSAQPGQAIICKDPSSPAGSYNFTISGANFLPGDQGVGSVKLSPGQCAVIYARKIGSDSFTTITMTEVIPGGSSYQLNHVAVDDADGPRNLAGPAVTLKVNQAHGALADYYNEPVSTLR